MDDSGWQTLYLSALEETKQLKKQIRMLETILREHLPVIGWDPDSDHPFGWENSDKNK